MNRETILADKLSTSYLVACRRVSLNRLAICASRHPQQCCMRDSKRIVCIFAIAKHIYINKFPDARYSGHLLFSASFPGPENILDI